MIEITAHIDNHRLAEVLSTDEFLDPLREALTEGVTESVSDALTESDHLRQIIYEVGSEAGAEAGAGAGEEAGQTAGWDAGRDAAHEAINDNGGELTYEGLLGRLDGEFINRSYEGGCGEWRTVYETINWGIQESIRVENGALHFLAGQRAGTTPAVEVAGDSQIGQDMNQRIQDLELLVAGLAQALTACISSDSITPLRTYAATASAHQWPAWMASVNTTN